MRDIKFRAWDAFNAEMFPEKVDDDLLVKFFREVNRRRNGGNTVIVMQYTGLKDKNGVEIYESDEVKTTLSSGKTCDIGIVKYSDNGYWKLEGDGKYGCNRQLKGSDGANREVIGNIYDKGKDDG